MKSKNLDFIYIIFGISLLAAFVVIISGEKKTDNDIRLSAYNFAVECTMKSGEKPKFLFNEINWVVVPEENLIFSDSLGEIIRFGAWFSPKDTVIYISKRNNRVFWINAHEIVHALGVNNHPDDPFRKCKLLLEQNNK